MSTMAAAMTTTATGTKTACLSDACIHAPGAADCGAAGWPTAIPTGRRSAGPEAIGASGATGSSVVCESDARQTQRARFQKDRPTKGSASSGAGYAQSGSSRVPGASGDDAIL